MYEGTDFFAASEEDYKYARLILETMLPEAIESVEVYVHSVPLGVAFGMEGLFSNLNFFPMVTKLSRCGSCGLHEKGTYYERSSPLAELLYDEGHKPNPVVQRVKVIMSAGMMIVHAHRLSEEEEKRLEYVHDLRNVAIVWVIRSG
ncbi:hypothetical protein ACFE04_019395 [Oxalis oulophora]